MEPSLPSGVRVRALTMHRDERGAFTEIFREEWPTGIAPVQWNVVRSEAGVLRGVHAHIRHADYLIVASGRMMLGLRDLRRGSATEGCAALLDLRADALRAVTIPAGVAHGFLFLEPSLHVYAVSETWNPEDELGCHWADPALAIPWPLRDPLLSPRDRDAPPLSALLDRLAPHQPIGGASPSR
ncbi:MAG: dTDP-4-dehydrorhamnose 3,5-epimerase family protein [Planctomycetaceae bacterium]